MESIMLDARRLWRSILDLAHARRDAHALSSGLRGENTMINYRRIGSHVVRDVYGREDFIDIYSGKEAFELYKKFSFSQMPPL